MQVTVLKPVVQRGMQCGLKVDIVFKGPKTIVSSLHRATWSKIKSSKTWSSNQKCCTPSKLQIEIKKKKIVVLKCKKMFPFEEIDRKVQFNSLFLENF